MKHIEILRWNIWRRPDENRNIELQVCVLLFSSQGQNCCCFLLLLCKRKIIACTCFIFQEEGCLHSWEVVILQIMILTSCHVPMMILKYKISFPFATFAPMMALSFPQHPNLPLMYIGNSGPDTDHTDTVTRALVGLTEKKGHAQVLHGLDLFFSHVNFS